MQVMTGLMRVHGSGVNVVMMWWESYASVTCVQTGVSKPTTAAHGASGCLYQF